MSNLFEKEYEASAHGAAAKVRFLEENPLGYVMVSLLGGAYLGFGVLLTYAIESYLGPQPSVHIIMGLSFGVALSLVIIAGAEMFTGDAFILYNGLRRKTVTAGDVVKLLVVCYLGNWLGALILSVIFYGTGLDTVAMAPHPDTINMAHYFYNLCCVTAGNVAGAIFFVSIPYGLASRHRA